MRHLKPLFARSLALLVLAMLTSGCATTLSSFQTGKPLPRGKVQVHAGAGVYAPIGQIVSVIAIGIDEQNKARDAIGRGEKYEIDEETAQNLLTAGIALGTSPPSMSYEVALRAGVLEDDLDVGLRYSVNALRLDTKYRLYHQDGGKLDDEDRRTSFDVAAGIAYGHYLFSGPAFKVLEFLKLDDFSRKDVEVPVYVSFEVGQVLKLYAVPKYVWSRTGFDGKLVALSDEVTFRSGVDIRLPAQVDAHFIGATTGIGLGYKYVHLFLELTSGYTTSTPVLFGRPRQLGGITLYPAVALAINFGKEPTAPGAGETPRTVRP